ncbi:hypothetical protein [Methyloferula stellata]|jgi:hypothetical protein|uniref:hypothetical protein n=1 Tax=Methyloferula stellata TaxID=876270 RepID=UPI000A0612FD|nr:hypothetical protein [Methyloferula stellata]
MQEQAVLEVPASPATGTNDLLSRLYREIGISAVAAALEINHPHDNRPLAESLMLPAVQPAAR